MMTKKENAKADFIKDLAEKMSREICENPELNEQEKDAAAVQVSVCVLSCVLANKTDAVKLKILGIVFDRHWTLRKDWKRKLKMASVNKVTIIGNLGRDWREK